MPSWWCHTPYHIRDSFYRLFLHTLTLLLLHWFGMPCDSDSEPERSLWFRPSAAFGRGGGIRFALFYFFFLSLSPFFTRRWYALCVGSCKCINRERMAPAVLLNLVDSWGTGFDRSDHSLISSSSLHFPGIVIYECSFIWLRLNMSTHRWRYHSTYFLCIVTCAIT